MQTAKRRAYLEAMVEKTETDHARLRALDLLDRRERPGPPTASDFARATRTIRNGSPASSSCTSSWACSTRSRPSSSASSGER